MYKTIVFLGLVVVLATAQNCTTVKVVTTVGAACDATNICQTEMTCDTSVTPNVCKHAPLPGSACTNNEGCASAFYNMFCSSNKCAISFKNAGASCTVNGECSSNNCASGSCAALVAGSSCSIKGQCGSPTNGLFCSTNGTCAATAASGAACGLANGLFTQCQPGLACVNTASGATAGTCQVPVGEGATCGSASISGIWNAPACSAATAGKLVVCVLSKCTAITTIPVGESCALDVIAKGAICDASTSTCIESKCAAYSSISCTTSAQCGGGVCNCATGKCGAPITFPPFSCALSAFRAVECSQFANTQNLLNVCGDKIKNLRCCARDKIVGNTDLTLAYCSSATLAKVSVVVMAIVALISMTF